MKFQKLLDEIRYGKDMVESMDEKDKILACLNEDTNSLIVSQYLKDKISLIKEDKEETKIVKYCDKIQKKFEEFEERYFDGKISSAYKKMKLSSIVEDYNTLTTFLDDKKLLKEFNQEDLSKVLSTIKYGVSMYGENEDIPEMNKTTNSVLNILIEEDESFLKSIF